MIKTLITSLFLLILSSCYSIKTNKPFNSNHTEIKFSSQNGKYLSANYSISKGDVFAANKILGTGENSLTLLELQFFSNLVSGNFKIANKISNNQILKNKNNILYKIPQFAMKIKNNKIKNSLEIAKKNSNFFGFNKIISLLEYWLDQPKRKTSLHLVDYKLPLYKLMVLENFYDIEELKKIANYNLNLKHLSNINLLFLAGYYYRLNDIKTFENIIKNKLSEKFDKDYIIKNFNSANNLFIKTPSLQSILSLYLYNISYISKKTKDISSTYIKILLEMSIFFSPRMDISKYSLAELYIYEKSENIALQKLNDIKDNSFFSLAGNLKKISIIKTLKKIKIYKKLLFQYYNEWPNNKFVLYELANFYRSQKNYRKASYLYKKLILNDITNNNLLFLYAICIDKMGKWDQAKAILLTIIESDVNDTYARNYVSYNLALKKQNLDLALILIKKAISIDSYNGFFLDTLGWVQYQRNNYPSALFYLEKAVTLEPNSSEIMHHLADCYLMLGRFNEAKYELNKAIQYETDTTIKNIMIEKLNKYE